MVLLLQHDTVSLGVRFPANEDSSCSSSSTVSHPEEFSPEAKAVTGLPAWHFSLQLTQHVSVGASCQGTHRVIVLCIEYRSSFPVCVNGQLC